MDGCTEKHVIQCGFESGEFREAANSPFPCLLMGSLFSDNTKYLADGLIEND